MAFLGAAIYEAGAPRYKLMRRLMRNMPNDKLRSTLLLFFCGIPDVIRLSCPIEGHVRETRHYISSLVIIKKRFVVNNFIISNIIK